MLSSSLSCVQCAATYSPKWYSGPACASCYQKERRRKYPEQVKAIARKSSKKRRLEHGDTVRATEREKRKCNKLKQKNNYLKCKYGITLKDYEDMLAGQNRVCKICQQKNSRTIDTGLVVDHDHATGKVRGLLCHSCNVALGSFRDSIANLEAAISYLRMYKK